MTILSKRIILQKCRMMLDSTTFESVQADGHISILKEPQITPDTYPIRHIIVEGNFNISFPDTDIPPKSGNLGVVFPDQSYSANSFQTKAQRDNSTYYCVLPSLTENLIKTETNLDQGESMTIKVTQLGFIFGSEFIVNSNIKNNLYVVACENNVATVTATQPCKIVTFQSDYYKGFRR